MGPLFTNFQTSFFEAYVKFPPDGRIENKKISKQPNTPSRKPHLPRHRVHIFVAPAG